MSAPSTRHTDSFSLANLFSPPGTEQKTTRVSIPRALRFDPFDEEAQDIPKMEFPPFYEQTYRETYRETGTS